MDKDSKTFLAISGRCSRWFMIIGIALTGLWLCALAGASFAVQASPVAEQNPYNHIVIWSGAFMISVSMIVVTVVSVRFSKINLGTWVCHSGVVLLTVGASWYALSHQTGYCVSQNIRGRWSEITSFFGPEGSEFKFPQTIQIINAQRQLYLASSVTKDYVCNLKIGDKQDILSFNNPVEIGKYRLTQGYWQMFQGYPEVITFQVATRPGIQIIWAGFLSIGLGLVYAFYVKPLIVKRIKKRFSTGLCILLVGWLAFVGGCKKAQEKPVFDNETQQFLTQIDTDLVNRLAVQHEGRICPLDTLARRQLSIITTRDWTEQSPSVTYLEFYFNTGRYLGEPILAVKSRKLKSFILNRLDGEAYQSLEQTGCIPPAMLVGVDGLVELFDSRRLGKDDLIKAGDIPSLRDTWKELDDAGPMRLLLDRLSLRYSAFLGVGALRLVRADGVWVDTHELLKGRKKQSDIAISLLSAWRKRDAQEVNSQIAELLKNQKCSAGNLRRLELIYNRLPCDVVILAGFAFAGLLLLFGLCGMKRLAAAGLIVFVMSTLFSGILFASRWIMSGRGWYLPPLASQYEAMTGSVFLVALVSLLVEKFWPRRIILTITSFYAVLVMVTLLFMRRLFPGSAGSALVAVSGILASRIMSLHVAVIVLGHAFAGMTMLLSLIYLVWIFIKGSQGLEVSNGGRELADGFDQSVGGVIDHANLILIQMASVCLILGTMLGAYWADFAWSRWWGWDPKETWALITALIYVMIVHLRFVTPVKWRGTVTAIGCIIGGLSMLFNWFAVNFIFVGLHSYS